MPIGQGIAVTPLQMARVYGAIANNGVAIQPHLVDRIGNEDSRKAKRQRLMSKRTARQIRAMLKNVVSDGSGIEAQIPGYVVAGKTGTAAKPDPIRAATRRPSTSRRSSASCPRTTRASSCS